ncbi:MAG TPA: molybdopterin-dependent oxidoreductase [Syntrophorhabdales bacterium]|nr:molybdopterin-dependent oxidoreductase [Syntrophorhabdales bacterium]
MTAGTVHNGGVEKKKAICWPSPGCSENCGLLVTVRDGRIVDIRGNQEFPSKGHGCADRMPHLAKWLYHPDQLLYPLKRKGERGENRWERITWDQALDEIAAKLAGLKATYGAESLALLEGTYRNDMYGIRSRFLNLFGNPGNIGCAGTICYCNRVAIRLAVTGTGTMQPKVGSLRCAVLGSNLTESGPIRWRPIRKRLKEGAKLIVVDPRKTDAAKEADVWLQIRPGTDAALFMAWINVIIEEDLYDKSFVDEWTFGFEGLKERASRYTPDEVSGITWIPAEKIRESARIYATHVPGIMLPGVSSDQIGLNSIRAEQARLCLRAITGNLSMKGGETVVGPGPIIDGRMGVRDSMLQLVEKLPPEQRKKQLGCDRFKLMGWPGYEIMAPLFEKTYGVPFPMSAHNFLCSQPLIWQAILTGKPYPIKAIVTWTSNAFLNAADTKTVYAALKSPNLDLHVVLEHVMTPTALLADYVLPIASKLEKPVCHTHEDFDPTFACGERAVQPLGERKPDYDFFRGLAARLGFGDYFPWETEEDLADFRLAPLGLTFKEAATERYVLQSDAPWTYETINPGTGRATGFATPTGKVELSSNVLKELGYDPLPFYEEPPESPVRTPEIAERYPFVLITGGRFRPMIHSENRQIGIGTREQHPEPLMDIHPDTARRLGIEAGDWAYVESKRGVIKQKAHITPDIDPRVIHVEGHWWFPEEPADEPWLHGGWSSNANVLTLSDPDTFDQVTGGWPLRALLCNVYKAPTVKGK